MSSFVGDPRTGSCACSSSFNPRVFGAVCTRTSGRAVQPRLTGGDVLALGVPRGPEVGRVLGMLRRKRLDGAAGSLAEERELVKEWLTSGKEA